MTTSPPSSSEPTSTGFHRLHRGVQEWMWDNGWTSMRPAQERAIDPIMDGRDVIITAATAGGKTEAAFLPVLSKIADRSGPGVRVLNISPLRALINDQHRRLVDLAAKVNVTVHRWHGDVRESERKALLKEPSGVLVITPESLEAMFVLRGTTLPRLFGALEYIVIDELHAFIGSERGQHLRSLLHRVESITRRRVPRVAMSATLGDLGVAARFLRSAKPDEVVLVDAPGDGGELRLVIRGYRGAEAVEDDEPATKAPPPDETAEDEPEDELKIAGDLYKTMRGARHLVFCNRRRDVERYTDLLRRFSERERVPIEFFAHHGSLSRELREDAERMLKQQELPATILCTSTLELGIDVGHVESVGQVGAPATVASLRQRLGRSGRRGGPAVLRMYIAERPLKGEPDLEDALRAQLVQGIAIVNLLLRRWCEPSPEGALHLSTLLHQVLSLIAQHGGVSAGGAYKLLAQTGPFEGVTPAQFAALLRAMGQQQLIQQDHDGTLVLGLAGERLVNKHDFYSVFSSPEEWRLLFGAKQLGTMPLVDPLMEDSLIVFGGKRWRVTHVEESKRVISVVPAPGGRPPRFTGTGGAQVHDEVRLEMRRVYEQEEVPSFLDASARVLLAEGREHYHRLGLGHTSFITGPSWVGVLVWRGDRVHGTVMQALQRRGLTVTSTPLTLRVDHLKLDTLRQALSALNEQGLGDALQLAADVKNKERNKHDALLSDELLALDYASDALDIPGAEGWIREVVG